MPNLLTPERLQYLDDLTATDIAAKEVYQRSRMLRETLETELDAAVAAGTLRVWLPVHEIVRIKNALHVILEIDPDNDTGNTVKVTVPLAALEIVEAPAERD